MSRLNINRLAAQVRQPNLPAFLTPSNQLQLHLAVIDSHDAGRNESTVIFNDFGNPPVPGIPVLRSYTATDVPQPDDVVQLLQIGQTLAVLGRQWRPSGIVTFG